MKRPRLGSNLSWHGNRIVVSAKVPPSARARMGRQRLKQSLPAGTTPAQAAVLKLPILHRMKQEIAGVRAESASVELEELALSYRDQLASADHAEGVGDGETVYQSEEEDIFDAKLDELVNTRGEAIARSFADIAHGRATPLRVRLKHLFERKGFSRGYELDIERALGRLERWCASAGIPATVEAITRDAANSYVRETFVLSAIHHKTANKDISALSSFWRWLRKSMRGTIENPWSEQRIEAPARRHGPRTDVKRPFTDAEVVRLLGCIRSPRERDFSLLAALYGMRLNEIANLTVGACRGGWFDVRFSKTGAGVRRVPIHPELAALLEARCRGKADEAYLFYELPDPTPGSKRDRGAPVTQAFVRERRAAGVDERAGAGQRQSNVDFHSWRRWFVRKAMEGLAGSGGAYLPHTIAEVVGRKIEGGSIEGVALPHGMTFGRYAGGSSEAMLRACVAAISLPSPKRA